MMEAFVVMVLIWIALSVRVAIRHGLGSALMVSGSFIWGFSAAYVLYGSR